MCASLGFRQKPIGKEPVAKASYVFKTTAQGGLLVVLDGSGSKDPDGFIKSYEWKQLGITPNPVKFNNANIAVTTAAPAYWVLGTYKFQLTVTDDQGGTDTNTIIVRVVQGSADRAAPAPVQGVLLKKGKGKE